MATLQERVTELEKKVNAILLMLAAEKEGKKPGWVDEYSDADEFFKEQEKGKPLVDWLKEKHGFDLMAFFKKAKADAIKRIKEVF